MKNQNAISAIRAISRMIWIMFMPRILSTGAAAGKSAARKPQPFGDRVGRSICLFGPCPTGILTSGPDAGLHVTRGQIKATRRFSRVFHRGGAVDGQAVRVPIPVSGVSRVVRVEAPVRRAKDPLQV